MEVAAACGVGVLAALCVLSALSWAADLLEVVGGAAAARDGFREGAASAAQSLGQWLMEAGIVPSAAGGKLADELRRLRFGDREPFSSLDDGTALGALAFSCASTAVVLGVVSWSVPGIILGFAGPAALLAAKCAARTRGEESRVAEAMPEAFGSLAISLESGLSLPQAMRYVGSHSQEPVRGHFMRASFSMSCGVSASEALDDMVDELSAPGLELVSLALKISQRTGAPLKDLLAEASQLAGDRIELARRLDVKTSQARMSAQLVAAMPVAMVGLLSLLSSDFRAGLATTTGAASVGIALALNLIAWLIIRRIMKVEL